MERPGDEGEVSRRLAEIERLVGELRSRLEAAESEIAAMQPVVTAAERAILLIGGSDEP